MAKPAKRGRPSVRTPEKIKGGDAYIPGKPYFKGSYGYQTLSANREKTKGSPSYTHRSRVSHRTYDSGEIPLVLGVKVPAATQTALARRKRKK